MKKRLLSCIVCICMVLCSLNAATFAKDSETIVILYENDVHCAVEGYSKLAAMKNELKSEYEYVGVVSSGDFVQGGTLGAVSKGEYIVELMNLVGYDAIAPGNHEFDYTISRLTELYELSETKYISCNFAKIGEEKTYFEPYTIVSYGDVDIAYIGIITPETITSARPSQFRNENGEIIYTFNESRLYELVQESIDEATEDGADYVIALSHIGYDESGELNDVTDVIENTDGLDVVLDAHSHSVIEEKIVKDKSGDDVLLSSTGTGFENIGKLTIANGEFDTELVKTETYTKTDADVDAYIAEINESYAELGNRKIGESKVELITHNEEGVRLVRTAETNLGNLCSDALFFVTNADVSYVNGGGLRAPIKSGDMTFNDIYSVFPFNNRIVTAEITGQVLLDMLEMSMISYPQEDGAFPHMSGITFSVNKSIPSSIKVDENGFFTKVDGDYRVYDVKVLDKESETRHHQSQGRHQCQFQGLDNSLGFPGTIVIGNNGNGGIVDAKQRHKEEALELEIDAEDAGGGFGKALQNLIHTKVHDRADAVHDDGRNTHSQNRLDNFSIEDEILAGELHFRIVLYIEVQTQ